MNTTERFWVVWCPTRGLPVVRHSSNLNALVEAERLAAKHPGEEFFVLEARSVSTAIRPVTTTTLKDPLLP